MRWFLNLNKLEMLTVLRFVRRAPEAGDRDEYIHSKLLRSKIF